MLNEIKFVVREMFTFSRADVPLCVLMVGILVLCGSVLIATKIIGI